MFFSFIVPVYNVKNYIDKCMASLLCQKGAEYEILLIDDGSFDGSENICDSYAEKYPDTVRVIHKHNEGLLLTRRRGFKAAKGDWFICIDSDDYANQNLLETVVSAINKFNPDLVMYNFEYVTDEGAISASRLNIPDESVYETDEKQFIYRHRLLTDDINNMWSKAIRRDILDIDYDYSNCGIRNMCEDAIQILPLFTNATKIIYLNTPLYYYRKGEGSITSKSTYENWLAAKSCFLITEKYANVWKISDEIRERFYTYNVENLSNFLRWTFNQPENELNKSKKEIIHTIKIHPAFDRCMKYFNKNYCKTSFLKFSVPLIMRFVQKDNIKGIKRYFNMEKKILKFKKG